MKKQKMNQSYAMVQTGVAYGYSNINWQFFHQEDEEVIYDFSKKILYLRDDLEEVELQLPQGQYDEVFFTKCGDDYFVTVREWGEMEEPLEGCLPYRTVRETVYPLFSGFKNHYRNPRHVEFRRILQKYQRKLDGHILSTLP